jgi:hypothetical protein
MRWEELLKKQTVVAGEGGDGSSILASLSDRIVGVSVEV